MVIVAPDRTNGHIPHSVGPPWTTDRSFTEDSVCTNHITRKRQNPWHRRDSNPQSHQASRRRPTHTAALVTEPTQQSKPIFVWACISRRVATCIPTSLSRLLPTEGLFSLSLLIVGEVNVTWCTRLMEFGTNFCWWIVTFAWSWDCTGIR